MPEGTFTRRSALRGTAAVALGLTTGFAAAQPVSAPDATLIDLARQLERLVTAERAAWDRHAATEDKVFVDSPAAPTRREVAGPYVGLDALPPEERYAKLLADPVDFWAASAAADAEHRTAMEEHARAVAAIERRHGVDRLERQARRLSDEVTAASGRLSEVRAVTPRGVAAKAVALLPLTAGDGVSSVAELERHLGLLNSVLEDAVRLGMGGAA